MVPSLASPQAGHPASGRRGAGLPGTDHRAAGRPGVDRCPGTLTVHRARDGGLARIRIPGGALPAPLLAAIGDWAAELGNGRIELTGRGNLQLRGLGPGAEVDLADRLTRNGLLPSPAHDRARNVLASPLSGRDGLGAWDIRPLVGELDRRLCASAELAELPGRFLFALDDGRGDVAGSGADATIVALPGGESADARPAGGRAVWRRGDPAALLLGGRDTGLRFPSRDAVGVLLAAATAFLARRADERVWRVSELPGGPLSLVPDIGLPGRVPELSVPAAEPRGPVGPIAQTDGRVALAAVVPLGELSPVRCRLLAELAAHEVVLTPWRGAVLPGLAADAVAAASERLAEAGLVLEPDSALLGVTACTGRPGCASALADVRGDALGLPAAGAGRAGPPVHWSGCARRCGRPSGEVVDVVAGEYGYQVRRGEVVVHSGSDVEAVRTAASAARHAMAEGAGR